MEQKNDSQALNTEMKRTKLDMMQTRLDRLAARVDLAKNRQKRKEKSDETRRRLLAGDYLFKLLGSDWERVGKRLSESQMLKAKDIGLFKASPESKRDPE